MEDTRPEPLEIERKFLIRMPDRAVLERESERFIDMEQIYLLSEDGSSRRIRRSICGGEETLYFTEKVFVTHVTRVEREREIGPREWSPLLEQADPSRRPIVKRRWCVPYAGHTLEIDVFPFWDDRAFCEAELASETEPLELPGWIRVVREVTEDPRYTNSALARELPAEELP
jgi:CYTH domain-containing protein